MDPILISRICLGIGALSAPIGPVDYKHELCLHESHLDRVCAFE